MLCRMCKSHFLSNHYSINVMKRIPKIVSLQLISDKFSETAIYTPGSYSSFPVYDDNGVEAYLSYGIFLPRNSRGKVEEGQLNLSVILEVIDRSGKFNTSTYTWDSILGEINSLKLNLDGENIELTECTKVKGDTPETNKYHFFVTRELVDAVADSASFAFRASGSGAYFDNDVAGFNIYSRLFSKLAAKWQENYEPLTGSSTSVFMSVELAGDDVLSKYESFADGENKRREEKEKREKQLREEREAKSKQTQAAQAQGCYIATAIYGSYDCSQVWTLRRFRDDILDRTLVGRCFIKLYYSISPYLVKKFGDSHVFKKIFKAPLDHLVSTLKAHGIEDSSYSDKY